MIYHYPGWHQPSAVFEFLVNKNNLANLTKQQRAILKAAAQAASSNFSQLLLSQNEVVLEKMIKGGIEMHKFPNSLLKELKVISKSVLEETCSND